VGLDSFATLTPVGRFSKIRKMGPVTVIEPVLLRYTSCVYSFEPGW
jgi:hypothetical protein